MAETTKKTERTEITLMLCFLAFILGILFGRYFIGSSFINVQCMADEIEQIALKGERQGFYFNGNVRNSTTIEQFTTFYWQYHIVSRGLLEMQINHLLTKCSR